MCTDGAHRCDSVGKTRFPSSTSNPLHCAQRSLSSSPFGARITHCSDMVKTVNFVKARPLNSCHFAALFNEMGADHVQLLRRTQIRRLSSERVLQRVFELHKKLDEFLTNVSCSHARQFKDQLFLAELAYLADIFNLLNDLNLSLQDKDTVMEFFFFNMSFVVYCLAVAQLSLMTDLTSQIINILAKTEMIDNY